MTVIFGQSLVYWSGLLTGIFFLLSFFGCGCNLKLTGGKLFDWIRKYHRLIVNLSLVFFIWHLILAVLSRNFNIWI